jgi:RNA polymerase sigma-70 factor (ECF subfamily)
MTSTDAASTDPSTDQFLELLRRARNGQIDARGVLLQWYGNYLNLLASTQLDRRLRPRMNPSDLVQETLLAAHRDFLDFRGETQPELLGWLRQILIHTLHRMIDAHLKAGKRDIRREVAMDRACTSIENSATNLAAFLPARGDSPSSPMRAREGEVEFAHKLSHLRPTYQQVIILRILQGLSFDEIAERMGRSSGAVRMLWLRALEQFKAEGPVILSPESDHVG